ncbi:fructose-6-phosphate aldolase [Lactiplantibacillus plantarum]|uniref:fructose-6-phosphate aldolase n=1 Tax=Lactiplantibacillus plantarum TaxID=1590 RepID=UPI001C69C304|nr:fructose-6-phosphate aldolase [Lactiplantibacillus plantarum]QYN63978.1 fructose-6-phosphate aldolase [Lactiplantibacillus plantarum]
MELLLDTVNLDTIKKYADVIFLAGVTSNPSIVKKERPIDFYKHMREVRQIIGKERTLHVQVVGQTAEAMLADAHMILEELDDQVYIKVPTDMTGLAVIKQLKKEDIHVTATAIYSEFQGYLAIAAGVDYLAPYYNRMINMNIDSDLVIKHLANQIQREQSTTKILAASFHTVQQINASLVMGAQAVTLGPDLLETALNSPAISAVVAGFKADWESLYGANATLASLSVQ